jgi:ABC-type spermidine/putrescine transport system permease subunit I
MIFLAPGLIFLAVLFLAPLGAVIYTSLVGGHGLTLAHYAELVSRPLYYRVFEATLEISVLATLLTLLIGYPVALHLAKQPPRRRAVLIAFVMLPFWTSILVKSFAFTVLLGSHGIVNSFLSDVLGLGRLPLLFNRPGVVIGMTHYLLPFMVFTILSNLVAQDPNLKRAAAVMGAGGGRIFWSITFPLSIPGVLAGAMLCLILSFGMFITPALLGGAHDMMISNLIDFDVRQVLDWGVAAALSVALLVVTAILTIVLAQVRGGQLLEEVK